MDLLGLLMDECGSGGKEAPLHKIYHTFPSYGQLLQDYTFPRYGQLDETWHSYNLPKEDPTNI